MRKFDAVIFDMDGVLIDSEVLYNQADQKMFQALGIELTAADVAGMVGVNLQDGTRAILKNHPELKLTQGEMEKIYADSLYHCLQEADELTLIPGVAEWITALYAAGVKLAVASSSTPDMVNYIVDRFGLSNYADVVINGNMVEHSKPEPKIFLMAAEELGIAPEHCAVVEDSPAGICAAKRAGMFCLAYSGANVHGFDQSQADVCVAEYTEETLIHLLG